MVNSRKIFILLFFDLIIIGISESLVGPLIPVLSSILKVNLTLIGLMLSIHSVGIIIASLLSGFLIICIGYKKILIYSNILIISSSFLLCFSKNYYLFTTFYFLLAIGNASKINSISSYVCDIYIENKSSRLLLINTGWLSGIFLAPLILSFITWQDLSYNIIFLFISILQTVVIFAICASKFQNQKSNNNDLFFKEISKTLFANKHFIFSCLLVFFYAAILNIFTTWFTIYFKNLGIDLKYSTMYLSIYYAATIAGMFLKNFFLRFFLEKKILLFSVIFSFIFLFLAALVNQITIKMLFIFLYGINIIGIITMIISFESNKHSLFAGPINGLIRSIDNFGIVLFHFLIGYLTENFKNINILYIDVLLLFILLILTVLFYFYNPYNQKIRYCSYE